MRSVRERLYARLAPCADQACSCSGCLLWGGCLNGKGYGCISVNGRTELTHRVAWSLDYGPLGDDLTVDHVRDRGCLHKHCANVAHLEPVSVTENIRRSVPLRVGRPRGPYRSRIALPDPANVAMLNAWLGREPS